jgi:hypothetical protein
MLVLAAVLAQAPAATAAAADETAVLERIRKAVSDPPAIVVPPPVEREGLVFRVTVRAPTPQKPVWDNWSNVPSYIRPNMTLYQYEYLQLVTPDEFRTSTVYSMNIPIGPLLELLGKHMVTVHRKTQQERAREEVRKALAEVLACRADPSRPGC